jgi:RNA polymerase sigma factor (sigma-70 family)
MAKEQWTPVIRYLRRLAAPRDTGDRTDGQLLERFATQQEEAAFVALLQRHGPLVWGLCRSVLHDVHDAEDAFQATFLVLVRKAGSIGNPESLASWLYGVAYRIAVRAKAQSAHRHSHERQGIAMEPAAPEEHPNWQEMAPLLHEELQRLPEKYRTPIVLCYFQGKSRGEVAQQLGWTEGAVKGMLERARDLLRSRLLRRGLVLSTGAFVALATENATAAVPAALTHTTIQAALLTAAGRAAAAGVISARVAALTKGALKMVFLTKLQVTAILLVTSMLGAGAGVVTYGGAVRQAETTPAERPAQPAASSLETYRNWVDVPSQREGVLRLIGTEIKPGEKLAPGQIVTMKTGQETIPYRRLNVGDRVEEGQLLARLDDRLAREELVIRKAKVAAAEADLVAADKTEREAHQRYQTQFDLSKRGTTSQEELRGAKLAWDRYASEAISKKEAVKIAKAEQQQAETTLSMNEIRSPIDGVIQKIYKHPGEAVRNLETVFRIRMADNKEN